MAIKCCSLGEEEETYLTIREKETSGSGMWSKLNWRVMPSSPFQVYGTLDME